MHIAHGSERGSVLINFRKTWKQKAQRIYSAALFRVHVMQRYAPLNQVSHMTQSENPGAHLKKRFELELMNMKTFG